MPGWMQSFNDWNPVIVPDRGDPALMTVGYDWSAIGGALVADAVVGVVLLAGMLWAFRRLAN